MGETCFAQRFREDFMTKDIQQRILELKKEKDVCILAHCY